MDYFFKGSIGKLAMGIEIDFENATNKERFQNSVKRETYGRAISAFPLLLGHLWALKDPQSKTWHDLMARSKVTEK